RAVSPRRALSWPVSALASFHPPPPDFERKCGFGVRWRGPAPRDRPGARATTSWRVSEIVRAVGIDRPALCRLTELIVLIASAVTAARAVVTVAISLSRPASLAFQ